MLVEQYVLEGVDKLSKMEQTFLVLLSELANDLTTLGKLAAAAERHPSDPLEVKASAVLSLVLLRLLGARIWQSWELLRSFYNKQVLAQSSWLRSHSKLYAPIRKLKREFPEGCVWDRIRNQFAYHYDPGALALVLANNVLGSQFEMVSSKALTNSFFISSELAIWYSILEVHDNHAFSEAYPALVKKAVHLGGDLVGVIGELFKVFVDHVVNDLGGSWEAKSSTTSISEVHYENAVLPLFGV